ncbi:MAG: cupin domain-containing protein [Campylobacteraceae bacterium]|nr:cupin domain-containing protein [Campylobacteraceae bacterium]
MFSDCAAYSLEQLRVFYVVSGSGEFLDDTKWKSIKAGDAFKALQGITHASKNTGTKTLVLFSTFSPATR